MGFVGPNKGASGTFGTLMNLIKPFIGAGILAMPNAWKEGGLITSSVILLLLAYVAGWCIFKLVEASELIMRRDVFYVAKLRIAREAAAQQFSTPVNIDESVNYFDIIENVTENDVTDADWATVTMPSFTDVGGAAFGRWGRVLVDISIIVTQFGALIAYIIFISTNLSTTVGLDSKYWVLILMIPLILLSFIRQMDKLAPTSALGNVVYLFVLTSIFYTGFDKYCCVPFDDLVMSNISQFAFVFGTCSFALEGIALVMPIKRRMKTPADFSWVMLCAMSIVTAIYLSFSVLGYMFFGEDTSSPVIDSLPTGTLLDAIKIALSISLFFTFAIQMFPATSFFDEKVDQKLDIDVGRDYTKLVAEQAAAYDGGDDPSSPMHADLHVSSDSPVHDSNVEIPANTININPTVEDLYPHLVTKRTTYQNVIRIIVVLVVGAIGIVFPDFKLVVSLFGSFSNAMLAYIFPAAFWIVVCSSKHLYGYEYFPYTRNGDKIKHPYEYARNGNAEDNANVNAPNSNRSNADAQPQYSTQYGAVETPKDGPTSHEYYTEDYYASQNSVDARNDARRRGNRSRDEDEDEDRHNQLDPDIDILSHPPTTPYFTAHSTDHLEKGLGEGDGDGHILHLNSPSRDNSRSNSPNSFNSRISKTSLGSESIASDTSSQKSQTEVELTPLCTQQDDTTSRETAIAARISIAKKQHQPHQTYPKLSHEGIDMKETIEAQYTSDNRNNNTNTIARDTRNTRDTNDRGDREDMDDANDEISLNIDNIDYIDALEGEIWRKKHVLDRKKQKKYGLRTNVLDTIYNATQSETTTVSSGSGSGKKATKSYRNINLKQIDNSAIPERPTAGFFKKVYHLFFPYLVTIAGICASGVGVYGAVNDIVKHYKDA